MVTEQRPILTLDTSAINHLADDSDCETLLARISAGFHVRLSFTCVSEVISPEDRDRRERLLSVTRSLLAGGDCIDPQHEIIRKMVARFEEDPSFDWREVAVDFPEAQVEIAGNLNFDDELAKEERESSRSLEAQFAEVFEIAKPAFDRLFEKNAVNRPRTVSELVTRLQEGGAFWSLAQRLYDRVAKYPADLDTIQRFVAACDPFRVLIIAVCVAQFDRTIRRSGPSLRSGRNDTFMAVCLPYCHHFITADARQLSCYREIVSTSNVALKSYTEFRDGLLAMNSAGIDAETVQGAQADDALRWQLYTDHKKQAWADIQSSTDSYDQSLLTLSSGGLGLSIAFIKDIIPLRDAIWLPLLYFSWGFFGLCILTTIVSFQVAILTQNEHLNSCWKFYIGRDDSSRNERGKYSKILKRCTITAGILFVVALVLTIVFAVENVRRYSKMTDDAGSKNLREGRGALSMTPLPPNPDESRGRSPLQKTPIPTQPAQTPPPAVKPDATPPPTKK